MNGRPGAGDAVLLVRFSSIGDLLLCEPVPRLLKELGVGRVLFLTKERFAAIPRGWPAVDEVLCLGEPGTRAQLDHVRAELRSRGQLRTLDLHNTLRSRLLAPPGLLGRLPKHRLQKLLLVHGPHSLSHRLTQLPPVWRRYQQVAGIPESMQSPPRLWAEGVQLGPRVTPDPGPDAPELLAPGAGKATKRWPLEHWVTFTRALLERSARPLVVLGGAGDRETGETLRALAPGRIQNLCGQADLSDSARLVASGRRILCGDTGLLHMAAAAGVPGVALFGPTTRELGFFPAGDSVRVLEHEGLDCRPCSHTGSDRCPRGHFRCMRELSPARVLDLYLQG
ncbi:MAG: glycosyltransferase family 9 protein [Calditrichaeota bacterium]|nr:glycosyltransferase family 9 protein [Calditrichota bacterium]